MADDEPFPVCPRCEERVEPGAAEVIYAVERCEVITALPWGPTRKAVDGMGRLFHAECAPEAIGWTRRERSQP